jgi:hypothetical protein
MNEKELSDFLGWLLAYGIIDIQLYNELWLKSLPYTD